MDGIALVIAFVLAIVVMIVIISKYKVHPFIAIMLVSLVFGLLAGIPLVDIKEGGKVVTPGIAKVIGLGFSGTFTSIGLVIIFGALIGSVLEATGAAFKLADMVIRLVGKKHPELAMELMGWVVSIPVFCDSGFVILNPIRKAIVNRTGNSSVALTMALAAGLYVSHVFIPPTPGPIAAASTLGIGDQLLLVIIVGILASILPLICGVIFAIWVGKRERSTDEANKEEIGETYEQIIERFGKLPNAFLTLAPIIVPVILMALGSIVAMAGLQGPVRNLLTFLGTPIIALAFGVLFSVFQLMSVGMLKKFEHLTQETLRTVGPILFVTAAGGTLGKVIASTQLVAFIESQAAALSIVGIFFPFLLSAILKTAQGSSTVAITTTAGILAPLMGTLGFTDPVLVSLAVMAIGAGAMTVSHANDSYFWVVTNFGGLKADQGYRTQTLCTLVLGVSGIIGIWIMYLICGVLF